MDISVVIPLFNEIESLKELHDWIKRVMHTNNFTYEIIFVDDGSTDNSWQVIEELSAKNKEIRGIKFRRNHGKAAALFCGFEHVKGEVIITMDADLQDSPDEIRDLYKMITVDNFDLVSGWKKKRHDPITKTIPTKLYNATARKVSKIKLHDFNCGLKAYKKNVIKSIEVYGEMHRYMPILAKQAGFKRIGEKVVQHQERKYGVTKFGIERFVNGFLDLISISFISKFSKRPMHFFGTIGTIMFLSGGFVSIWLIAKKIYNVFNHLPVREIVEQPLFYIALLSIIIGVQLFLAGFLAELVSRSSPERNKYNVEKTI